MTEGGRPVYCVGDVSRGFVKTLRDYRRRIGRAENRPRPLSHAYRLAGYLPLRNVRARIRSVIPGNNNDVRPVDFSDERAVFTFTITVPVVPLRSSSDDTEIANVRENETVSRSVLRTNNRRGRSCG